MGQETSLRLFVADDLLEGDCRVQTSDFSKLSQDHIREYQGVRMFEVRSQKTDERVSIPIHPVVEEIMASRNGRLPSFQNDQLMNRNLKRIGLMAELDGMEEVERTEGGLRQSRFKPKYELLQTHTARRSFCTNAYIKGLDVGHHGHLRPQDRVKLSQIHQGDKGAKGQTHRPAPLLRFMT